MVFARLLARRSFALPEFDLAPLEFCEGNIAELAELLLDQPLPSKPIAPNVVAIRNAIPSPGEMRERIERHLESRDAAHPLVQPSTPAEELRQALADLRRSIG
jgi:hypothetical protein